MVAPLVGAAAIGAGSDLLGGYLASREAKKATRRAERLNERQRAAAFAYLQRAQGADLLFGNLERSALMAGHKKELAGFQGAERALGLGRQAGVQTIQGQGKINQAEAEQSVISRGLLGTSTGMQTLTGAQDRTTSQLSALDLQYAQALASLGLDKASLEGEQGRALSALAARSRDIQREFGYELASLAPMAPEQNLRLAALAGLAKRGSRDTVARGTTAGGRYGSWA